MLAKVCPLQLLTHCAVEIVIYLAYIKYIGQSVITSIRYSADSERSCETS